VKAGLEAPLLVVVGSGGVGKTTLAASLGLHSAATGTDTLVMTFDPSRRLKDALGVGERAADRAVAVQADLPARLDASLLDPRATFDRLIGRYAPDPAVADRIYRNRFYHQLAGTLAGILEYMAVEQLFEVAEEGGYGRVILDTPPTRQAIEFLHAPQRMVAFLDSGALKVALKPWFDDRGRLKAGKLKIFGKGFEALLDRLIGLALLRDIAEFFQAFGPLYEGFRSRAREVQALLRSERTHFVLVSGPGEERVADTLFFARKLVEDGCHLGPVVVNQVHPEVEGRGARREGRGRSERRGTSDEEEAGLRLFAALAERDRRGVASLRSLLPGHAVVAMPLMPEPPTSLAALRDLGARLADAVSA
jgi:anion-transporting  ArsA/GET3 family ATPase